MAALLFDTCSSLSLSLSVSLCVCECLSLSLSRYIPVGLLERTPQRINDRPPYYLGRDYLESLMASQHVGDWVKIRWGGVLSPGSSQEWFYSPVLSATGSICDTSSTTVSIYYTSFTTGSISISIYLSKCFTFASPIHTPTVESTMQGNNQHVRSS